MTRTQIFGYTPPSPPSGYVSFITAFSDENGITISVRNSDGVINEILLPQNEVEALIRALTQGQTQ